MKKGWTTTKLMAIGGLSVLALIIGIMATIITSVTGMALASGFITSFLGPIIIINALLITNEFGTGTVYYFIYSILALPTHLWGPPGFFLKIPLAILIGLLVDLSHFSLRKLSEFFSLVVVVLVINLLGTFIFIFLGKAFGLSGVDRLANLVSKPTSIILFVLVAFLDVFLAKKIFLKIKDTAVVRRIQG